jgi:hypothetical protein
VDILRRCEKLVKCRLHASGGQRLEATASVTVPDLQSLTIKECLDIAPVLDCLRLPSPRHLGLAADRPPFDTGHFLRAVRRHTEFLTSVDLTIWLFSHDTLLAFFQLVPNLCELRLRRQRKHGVTDNEAGPQIDDSILHQLTPVPSNSSLCVMLAEVEFHDRCATFSDDTLATFIVARMKSSHPLKLLTVQFGRAAQRAVSTELKEVITGLELRLAYVKDPWRYQPRDGFSLLAPF